MEEQRRSSVGRLSRAAASALAAVCLLLAACAPSSPSTGAGGGSGLTYAFANPIKNLDINSYLDNSAQVLLGGNVLEALTKEEYKPDGTLTWGPALAESYTRVAPTQWRFVLAQGLKFQNGAPVTADDVVYSVTKRLDPKSQPTSVLANIDHAVKVDDHTVDIFSKAPDNFVDRSVYYIYIQPKGWGTNPADAQTVIGTGPYRFVSKSPAGDNAVIEAWDGYRGPQPTIKKITMRSIPEAGARLAALQAGEVQVAFQLDPDLLTRAPANISVPGGEAVIGRINANKAPFNDVQVRQALNMAIDRKSLIANTRSGFAVPANGQSLVPFVSGYDNSLTDYPFDPAAAKKIISDKGLAGTPLSLMCNADKYGPIGRNECQTVGQMFGDIGFTVSVDMQPDDKWISDGLLAPGSKLNPPDVLWVPTSSTSAGAHMTSWYSCTSTRNTYCDQKLVADIKAAQQIQDVNQQQAAWKSVMEYVRQQAPMVFLDVPKNGVATAAGVKGVVYPVIQDIYWSEWSPAES